MKRATFFAIILCTALMVSAVMMPGAAQAKAKDFIFSVSMAMYPEFSEGFAVNATANHIYGRSLTHPALKGKHNMKIYDKGMLYPNQDEHLQAISRGALQMTYSGPHYHGSP